MTRAWLWYLRATVGLGAIFTALSELLFYPVSSDVDLGTLALFYGIGAVFAVAVVARRSSAGWLGFYIVATIVGYAAEGVVVPEIYTAMPFTIVWTSLAWHALISGLIGVWLVRSLSHARAVVFAVFCLGFGLYLGLWGGYFWGAEEASIPYVEQAPWGFALFFAGHLILPGGSPPRPASGAVIALSGALMLVGFVLLTLAQPMPGMVLLPPLIGLSILAAKGQGGPLWPSLRWSRIWIAALIPIAALLVQTLVQGTSGVAEMNLWTILIAGPASVGLLLYAFVQALKNGRKASLRPS